MGFYFSFCLLYSVDPYGLSHDNPYYDKYVTFLLKRGLLHCNHVKKSLNRGVADFHLEFPVENAVKYEG